MAGDVMFHEYIKKSNSEDKKPKIFDDKKTDDITMEDS